jgi:hypothetical protein
MGWQLDNEAMGEIARIIRETVTDPVGPEFMAPPARNRPTANPTVASDNTTGAHAARG